MVKSLRRIIIGVTLLLATSMTPRPAYALMSCSDAQLDCEYREGCEFSVPTWSCQLHVVFGGGSYWECWYFCDCYYEEDSWTDDCTILS